MKTLLLFAAALCIATAHAQETGVPSGRVLHSYVGYVSGMDDKAIQVAQDADSDPVVFVYENDTPFMDAEGNRTDKAAITNTTLVKIDYSLVGDRRQIVRIVVNPELPATAIPPSAPAPAATE